MDLFESVTGVTSLPAAEIASVEEANRQLERSFAGVMEHAPELSRALVSFQDNKRRPAYRWFKYKEAFSASLVRYLLGSYSVDKGALLDPFAGSGTALFAGSELGFDCDGIELLPIGQEIVKTRLVLEREFAESDFATLERWRDESSWRIPRARRTLRVLRITRGAYSQSTLDRIERYLAACDGENARVRQVLLFALLCVLESVSYTRKDGQYLRWDYRSGRRAGGKRFDKGPIEDFDEAIRAKIGEILQDCAQPCSDFFGFAPTDAAVSPIRLFPGSCLGVLPRLKEGRYSVVFTSPPYCNRYDYTRTYALELAALGVSEEGLTELRQEMLSCTVENRAKDLVGLNPSWRAAVAVADGQELLQAVLSFLESSRLQGALNNNGIPRMVRGYFYEMACVIQECSRLLKRGGHLFMVNDNVRYAGVPVSVDLILSSLARDLGFDIERILVLPQGKGNSSQQMGNHGRTVLRKCVYLWKKK